MGSLGTGLLETPSYHKGEKASAWPGVDREKWRGEEDFGNGGLKLEF